jgi:uroporphyrin-III C-methyltransferase
VNTSVPPEAETPAILSATPARSKMLWRHPAVLIAAVALVLLGWQWLETRARMGAMQEELAKRLSEIDAVAKESRIVARQNVESLQVLQAKMGAVDARVAEAQGQQLAMESIYLELSKGRDERLLAEVEQAVAMAAQQLQLAGNVQVALIALSGAEARLARASQPQFLGGIRKLIARDIERLKALPTADVPGLALKLEGVIAVVDTMPLAYEQRPKAEPPKSARSAAELSFWQSLAADIWTETKQMVRIERIDAPGHADPALLSPSQSIFLRENLKLRLVNARLALLSRDGRSFREDVRQAGDWLERYFDSRAKPVQASMTTLKSLATVDVGVDLPSLNETLDSVRKAGLIREKK